MNRNFFSLILVGFFSFSTLCAPTSADDLFPAELVRFKAFEKNPVFTAQGKGHWDVEIRERGWILREGDTYHMWFTGYDGSPTGLRMIG